MAAGHAVRSGHWITCVLIMQPTLYPDCGRHSCLLSGTDNGRVSTWRVSTICSLQGERFKRSKFSVLRREFVDKNVSNSIVALDSYAMARLLSAYPCEFQRNRRKKHWFKKGMLPFISIWPQRRSIQVRRPSLIRRVYLTYLRCTACLFMSNAAFFCINRLWSNSGWDQSHICCS